jgi:hypothetical protein
MKNVLASLWSRARVPASGLRLIAFAMAAGSTPLAQDSPHPAHDNGAVQVQMHNVMYHYSDSAVVHLRDVGGALVPTKPGQMPVFDDKNSFGLQVTAAEIAIEPQSLAAVLNANVFSAKDAPLKDLAITIERGNLKVKGKLHQKGDVSFETEGQLSATPDGKIRLHADKIKALHLPVKGLMDLLGLDVADLIKNGKVRGVQVEKDDLIFDAGEIFPPPRISGHVTAIRLEGNNIVQIFGEPQKYPWKHVTAKNYMAYSGNRLQFGKLVMTDTDMVLIDPEPSDPFDFDLDHYKDQLVAGYSKTTPSFGLRVYMVDFNKLKKQSNLAPATKKSR